MRQENRSPLARWIRAGLGAALLSLALPGASHAQQTGNPIADFLGALFPGLIPPPGMMMTPTRMDADFQGPPDDPFGAGFTELFGDDPRGAAEIQIEGVDLDGPGCPATDQVRSFLTQDDGLRLLRVQFSPTVDGFLLAGTGNSTTRTCTVRARVSVQGDDPDARFSIGLERIAQGVRFINPGGTGELVARSQFRVGESASPVRAIQFPESDTGMLQPIPLRIPPLQTAVAPGDSVDLLTAIQLEVDGGPDAALRFEELALELLVSAP